MSAPLVTGAPDLPIRDAVRLMDDRGVTSLVVTAASGDSPGLATHRSISRLLAERGVDPSRAPISLAAAEPHVVDVDAPLWKVQEHMRIHGARQVAVSDAGRLVGMVTHTDLLRALAPARLVHTTSIESATTYEDLAECHAGIPLAAEHALESNRHAYAASRILSETHLAIQRRCVALTLDEMTRDGFPTPDVPFAFVVMGSGGRKEMLLDPDQDNGMILGHAESDPAARAWAERLSDRVNVNLDRVGYVLCPGDIMARNDSYRKSLQAWCDRIDVITDRPNERSARWSNIVLDFDTLYGDPALAIELRRHLLGAIESKPRLLQYMVDDDARGRAPLNWFNRLVATGERDGMETVDVKRNGLRIIADAARILALREGSASLNTHDRIQSLVRGGALSVDFGASVSAAHDALLDILLAHQIERHRQVGKPDKEVAPEALDPIARETLRVAMRAVKRFQEFLQDRIGSRSSI